MLSLGKVDSAMLDKEYFAKDEYFYKDSDCFEIFGDDKAVKSYGLREPFSLEKIKEYTGGIHRPLKAVDMCFSLPKSFSIQSCLDSKSTSASDIDKCFSQAVKDTLRHARESGMIQIRSNADEIKQGEGDIWMIFSHEFSRKQSGNIDPSKHKHALLMNAGWAVGDSEEKNCSIYYKEIYKNKIYLGSVMRSYFAENMKELGYKLSGTDIKNNYFELHGYSREQTLEFSSRNNEISKLYNSPKTQKRIADRIEQLVADKQMKSLEFDIDKIRRTVCAEEKKQISLTIREAKGTTHDDKDAILANIRERASDVGINSETCSELKADILSDSQPMFIWEMKIQAVNNAIFELSEKEGIFTKQDINKESITQGLLLTKPDGLSVHVTPDDVQKILRNYNHDLIAIPGEKSEDIYQKYTTRSLLEHEANIYTKLAEGVSSFNQVCENADPIIEEINRTFERERGWSLKDEQIQAAKAILENSDLFVNIQGKAGTGKTTMLEVVRIAAEQQGREVIGASLAGSAADNLQNDSGISSNTVHKLLIEHDAGKISFARKIVALDEAAMVDSIRLSSLANKVYAEGGSIALVGDVDQLPPVGAGHPILYLTRAGVKTYRLDEISRQKSMRDGKEWQRGKTLREVALHFSKGSQDVSLAFQKLHSLGAIKEIKSKRERHKAMVTRYVSNVNSGIQTLMLTSTNADRQALNLLIRRELRQKGLLNAKDVEIKVENKDGTSATKCFCEGDSILITKSMIVKFDESEGVNRRSLKLNNGEVGKIFKINNNFVYASFGDGKNQKHVCIDTSLKKNRRIDHGYCVTTHSSQGRTYDEVIAEANSKGRLTFYQSMNVGVSRERYDLEVYTDDAQALEAKSKHILEKQSALEVYREGIELEKAGLAVERKSDIQETSRPFGHPPRFREETKAEERTKGGKDHASSVEKEKAFVKDIRQARDQYQEQIKAINAERKNAIDRANKEGRELSEKDAKRFRERFQGAAKKRDANVDQVVKKHYGKDPILERQAKEAIEKWDRRRVDIQRESSHVYGQHKEAGKKTPQQEKIRFKIAHKENDQKFEKELTAKVQSCVQEQKQFPLARNARNAQEQWKRERVGVNKDFARDKSEAKEKGAGLTVKQKANYRSRFAAVDHKRDQRIIEAAVKHGCSENTTKELQEKIKAFERRENRIRKLPQNLQEKANQVNRARLQKDFKAVEVKSRQVEIIQPQKRPKAQIQRRDETKPADRITAPEKGSLKQNASALDKPGLKIAMSEEKKAGSEKVAGQPEQGQDKAKASQREKAHGLDQTKQADTKMDRAGRAPEQSVGKEQQTGKDLESKQNNETTLGRAVKRGLDKPGRFKGMNPKVRQMKTKLAKLRTMKRIVLEKTTVTDRSTGASQTTTVQREQDQQSKMEW